ncbi:MAG: Clp protease N-terminal domain-containing protein, partial [Pseudomonadales bacterium]
MLSKDLELNLNSAFKGARARRHEFMTVEHLLLALLDNETAARVLRACGSDLGQLRGELAEFVETTTPVIP